MSPTDKEEVCLTYFYFQRRRHQLSLTTMNENIYPQISQINADFFSAFSASPRFIFEGESDNFRQSLERHWQGLSAGIVALQETLQLIA